LIHKKFVKYISLVFIFSFNLCFLKYFKKVSAEETLKTDFEKLEGNIKAKSRIKWEKLSSEKERKSKPLWIKYEAKDKNIYSSNSELISNGNYSKINSYNRSIVFNNRIIGPDIGYLVPPGFKWNKRYKIDGSIRGRNRRKKGESFFGWNGGDAMSQFYYQVLSSESYSFGLNLGVRSIYSGSGPGGGNPWGEGSSLGFRIDKELSNSSGLAFGAEQLIQFDNMSDTGRDIYITASKGWWNQNKVGDFPLTIGTFGVGTGKLAVGNIKGLCSDLFGGDGTEIAYRRRLCWAPIFSLARVHNSKISTFFEYNSKWFLLGSSIAPFNEVPLRGTFAIQISDHIENYKVNNFENLKWVFRLSLGI
tara:strand:- start:407 stop:1492 length:1086 start_codon:yes stop_codon:yes gene_type:complete